MGAIILRYWLAVMVAGVGALIALTLYATGGSASASYLVGAISLLGGVAIITAKRT